MSLFPPDVTGSIISRLLGLVKGPVGRTIGINFKNTLPQVSGPFRMGTPGAHARLSSPTSSASRGSPFANLPLAQLVQAVKGATAQQQMPVDPLSSLYEQLLGQLQSQVPVPTGVNTSDLMSQVRGAIDPIYNQRESSVRNQTAAAQKDVMGMYNQLADQYRKEAPEAKKQAEAAKAEIEQLYGQLRSNIEGSYARVSNEQSDLFKQLGIEDALPDVLAGQNGSVTDALTAASQTQAQNAQRYMDIGEMDQSYYREGAPLAALTGTNYSKDLAFNLQDMIGQLEAQRASGIQTSYTDLLQQAQSQLGQQQQQAYSENARRQGMLWDMLQSQMASQQKAANTQITPSVYMSTLPPNIQQGVASAFTQLERSPEAVYGKVQDPRSPVPGTFTNITPQWYMAQADEMLRRGEIDETTHQALLMYMQLYFNLGG